MFAYKEACDFVIIKALILFINTITSFHVFTFFSEKQQCQDKFPAYFPSSAQMHLEKESNLHWWRYNLCIDEDKNFKD